jgi:ribosomal protein L24, bacterial/organelle
VAGVRADFSFEAVSKRLAVMLGSLSAIRKGLITGNWPLFTAGEKMPSVNIHRNDTVQVLTGTDRGKTGRVLRVFPDKGTVLVEHVRMVKKTISSKTSRQRTKGGIAEQESPISISNVMLVCPNCGPSRVGRKMEGDSRVRVCKKCGQTLPTKK